MKVLVSVAGRLGAVVAALVGALEARGVRVDRRAPLAVETLAGYDGVVVGSAVYLGRWLPSASSLLERHGRELGRTPLWLLSGGGLGALDVPPGLVRPRGHWVVDGPGAERLLWLGDGVVVRLVGGPAAGRDDTGALTRLADVILAELEPAGRPGE